MPDVRDPDLSHLQFGDAASFRTNAPETPLLQPREITRESPELLPPCPRYVRRAPTVADVPSRRR